VPARDLSTLSHNRMNSGCNAHDIRLAVVNIDSVHSQNRLQYKGAIRARVWGVGLAGAREGWVTILSCVACAAGS